MRVETGSGPAARGYRARAIVASLLVSSRRVFQRASGPQGPRPASRNADQETEPHRETCDRPAKPVAVAPVHVREVMTIPGSLEKQMTPDLMSSVRAF